MITIKEYFGTKNGSLLEDYMHPTEEEIRAETMLALANGVRGVYEKYYSRLSGDKTIEVVNIIDNNYVSLPQWYEVHNLISRINESLAVHC